MIDAPFPWFGGKRRVAGAVWAALGDVDNYIEPFAGSLAVLLGRPADHLARPRTETVNDADAYLCNFWRAIKADPEGVAAYAVDPVNETDLFARHLWLIETAADRVAYLESDPDAFDVKVAGWWVWGICAWLGSGWCVGNGPWRYGPDGRPTKAPLAGNSGQGVNRQLPHLTSSGQGVNRQLPHLTSSGQGVNRQLPHLGDDGCDVNASTVRRALIAFAEREPVIAGWFAELAARLDRVRVCAGDWSRVVNTGALHYGSTVGVFLDPPYLGAARVGNNALYVHDDLEIAAAVRTWAIENASDRVRVVLAGYADEHDDQIPADWRRHRWSAERGYAKNGGNRHNETLWISPDCLAPPPTLLDLITEE